MDRRWLRILVLGFACLWFGMLVPVHQRGQIQLPGSADAAATKSAQARHCNRTDADAPCRKGQRAPDDDGGGQGSCAVCHFIAGLQVPPQVTVAPRPLGLLRTLPAEDGPAAPSRHPALPFHGLDPPLA